MLKRKEILDTIAEVGELTFDIEGSLELVNRNTGETVEVDLPMALSVIRGCLLWFERMLGYKPDSKSAVMHLGDILTLVGEAIAFDISDEDE